MFFRVLFLALPMSFWYLLHKLSHSMCYQFRIIFILCCINILQYMLKKSSYLLKYKFFCTSDWLRFPIKFQSRNVDKSYLGDFSPQTPFSPQTFLRFYYWGKVWIYLWQNPYKIFLVIYFVEESWKKETYETQSPQVRKYSVTDNCSYCIGVL